MIRKAMHHDALKRHNLTQILLEIQRRKVLVKSDLVKQLHLSFASVSAICEQLEQQGLIHFGGEADSTGGRRPKKIMFNPKARFIISVDLSMPEHQGICLLDLDYTLLDSLTLTTQDFSGLLEEIQAGIDYFCIRHQFIRDSIIGLGAIVPGLYDAVLDTIHYPSNRALGVTDFRSRMEQRCSLPVEIVNDADVAALGQSINTDPPTDNLILLYFSEGVGLGMVHQELIYSGSSGMAGEFGKVSYPVGEKTFPFEQCIMLETMLRMYGLTRTRGSLPPLEEVLDEDERIAAVPLESFLEQLANFQTDAVEVMNFFSRIIGWAIANLIDVLDPSSVCIGGNIEPLLPYMLPQIREHVSRQSVLMKVRSRPIKSVRSKDIILKGSGKLVFQRWLREVNL
jgi:predicted NBD/HSP70 family sugar kinase